MNISFYTGASGMIAQQDGMNIYSNNIANVNTVGFKSLRPSFADCVYTTQRQTEEDWQTGHGQYIMKTDFMWEQGSFFMTEQELDFAIPNDNFFMVVDERGDTYLTRDGSFEITQVDDHWELVNGCGEFVLDSDGNHIIVPFKTGERNIVDENGYVVGTEEYETSNVDYDAITDMIGLYEVDNNWGLEQAEDNHFVITERSGEPRVSEEREIIRQALEMSTVDLASEMVHLIETQRSYQLSARVVTTSDELMSIANNLRN